MNRLTVLFLSLLLSGSLVGADPPCSCSDERAVGSWCESHERGHLAGIEIRSRQLFESAEASKLRELLASGERVEDPDALDCPVCRKNATSHGWCANCGHGMIGAIEIEGRASFVEADRALHSLLAANPRPVCNCTPTQPLGSWCEQHGTAWIAGLQLTSWELFEALDAHGHEIDIDLIECGACKQAHAGDGFCEEHGIGFLDGMAYLSALTYSLAKGDVRLPASITCPVCRKNSETHGWCGEHELGMVGSVELRNNTDYRRAAEAYERLLRARETAERCEVCAAVMMMDGRCRLHEATYKDGERVDR